MSLNDKLTG